MRRSYSSDAGTVVVLRTAHQGLIAGLLGCLFGILGIFTWGLIFVPLAAICALVGLVRGVFGASATGIGCSLLATFLTVWGFVVSPTLWLLVGAGILAQHTRPAPMPAVAVEVPRITAPSRPPGNTERELAVSGQLRQKTDNMRAFNASADVFLARISGIEARYGEVTQELNELLIRKRQLPPITYSNNGILIRSKISNAMIRGSISTDRLNVVDVQPAFWRFKSNITNLKQQVDALKNTCNTYLANTSNADFENSCHDLTDLYPAFEQRFDAMSRGFDALNTAYRTEKDAQQQFISAANQIP